MRAAALVAAAVVGSAASAQAPTPAVVVAQIAGIPASPGFKMNVVKNDAAPVLVESAADKPASAASSPKGAKGGKAHGHTADEPAHGETAHGEPAKAAEGHHGEAKAPGKAESAAEDKHAAGDPMDVLRDKLAAKLGAKPASGGKYAMQVSNRGESGENVITAVRPKPAAAAHPGAAHKAAAESAASSDPEANANIAVHGGGAVPAAHWDYSGAGGPESWGALKPEFSKCATGARQSPIDIRDGIAVDLEPIKIDYHPSSFSVIDNGHTVQVNVEAGNTISITGRHYELLQFHFHRPSEERINGRQFDMVVHLVHKDLDGKLAVIAVLLERGSAQAIVQTVWNNLPLEKGEEVRAGVKLDLQLLLPQDRRYYTYMGSLTTPPCSEGVLWMVMKQPVPISQEQLAIFSHLYPMNARPTQQAGGRLIKQSN